MDLGEFDLCKGLVKKIPFDGIYDLLRFANADSIRSIDYIDQLATENYIHQWTKRVVGVHLANFLRTRLKPEDVTFSQSVAKEHRDFVLSLSQEMRTKNSARDSIPMLFVCIGTEHAEKLIDFSLPTLISSYQCLPKDSLELEISVVCDLSARVVVERGLSTLKNLPTPVTIRLISTNPGLARHAILCRENARNNWTWQMTYLVNAYHYGFLESCRNSKTCGMLGWPDWIYSDRFFIETIESKNKGGVLTLPVYRSKKSAMTNLKLRPNEWNGGRVSSTHLTEIVLRNPHKRISGRSRALTLNPPRFFWEIDDSSFCCCLLNLAPYYFDVSKIPQNIELSLDPVDGIFCSKYWLANDYQCIDTMGVDCIEDSASDDNGFFSDFSLEPFVVRATQQLNSFTIFSLSYLRVHSKLGLAHERALKEHLSAPFSRFRQLVSEEIARRAFKNV